MKNKKMNLRLINLRHSSGEHARVVHLLLLKQSLLHEGLLLLLQLKPLLHIPLLIPRFREIPDITKKKNNYRDYFVIETNRARK